MDPQAEIDGAIAAIRRGDLSAFRRIVELSERSVRIVIVSVLPAPDLFDDIAQEVFLKIYKQLDDYTIGTNFLAWIKAYARNAARTDRRAAGSASAGRQAFLFRKTENRQRKRLRSFSIEAKALCAVLLHRARAALIREYKLQAEELRIVFVIPK